MTAPTKADTANEVVAWYAMPVDEVVKTLATGTAKGLSAIEASTHKFSMSLMKPAPSKTKTRILLN